MMTWLTADESVCVGEGENKDGMRRLVRECVMTVTNTSPNQLLASTHH